MSYKSGSRTFQTLDSAKEFTQRVFARTGGIIAITENKRPSAKQATYLFFLRNAGTSYNPKTQTKRQGQSEGARKLAQAERDARALGYTFSWEDDWTVGSHVKKFDGYTEEPSTCESCIMLDSHVDDASREYRRVIEAELALEELGK